MIRVGSLRRRFQCHEQFFTTNRPSWIQADDRILHISEVNYENQ